MDIAGTIARIFVQTGIFFRQSVVVRDRAILDEAPDAAADLQVTPRLVRIDDRVCDPRGDPGSRRMFRSLTQPRTVFARTTPPAQSN